MEKCNETHLTSMQISVMFVLLYFFSDRWLTLTSSKQVLQEGDGKLQFH